MLIYLLRSVLQWFTKHKQIDDSNIFQKVHYRASTAILLACIAILIFSQSTGNHIHCLVGKPPLQGIIDQYCYWLSTFILINNDNNIYYGVGTRKNEEVEIIAYYQWMQLFLVFQCAMFYLGRLYWKTVEKNRLYKTVELIKKETAIHKSTENEIITKFIEDSTKFTQEHVTKDLTILLTKTNGSVKPLKILTLNRDRGLHFVLVEIINLLSLCLQFYISNAFLQGKFKYLGLTWYRYNREDLLNYVFPKMTKCTFENIGPSGTAEKSDAMCFLPQNVLHEKMFVFLWFWFVFVLLLTTIGLCGHLFQYYFFRHLTIHRLIKNIVDAGKERDKILNSLNYTDFVYLTHIMDNLKFYEFNLFVKLLKIDLDEETLDNPIIRIVQTINTSTTSSELNQLNDSISSEGL